MREKYLIISLILCLIYFGESDNIKITQFKSFPHEKNCYTQGFFFLNQTHALQSCGLYDKSYYRVLKYQQSSDGFKFTQTYKSKYPIDPTVFLQGATYLAKTKNIYLITWRQRKVFKLNRETFEVEQISRWSKDGWGLTSNETHMFVTDGGASIYIVDQNFNILSEKTIQDQKGNKVYSINQLQYVVQNGKPFIYANVYMQRRIIKIDMKSFKVVQQYDMLKIIQNQKNLKYDEVINGIAFHQKSGKYLITGKNWGNFYQINLN